MTEPEAGKASASIEIKASPEAVYDLVSDVARMGEWSPEATGAVGASEQATAGDHFWGLNRKGIWRWFTRCTVREAQRGRRFVFDVDLPPMPISRWIYEFEDTDEGCRVTETWQDRRRGQVSAPIKKIGGLLIPGPRTPHNQRNIETTLQRLKTAAEN